MAFGIPSPPFLWLRQGCDVKPLEVQKIGRYKIFRESERHR